MQLLLLLLLWLFGIRVPAPPPGSPPASPRSPVEATVPRLAAVPDPAYGQLLCGHRANAREPDCDVCKLLDADSKSLVIELANPLKMLVHESKPLFERAVIRLNILRRVVWCARSIALTKRQAQGW